MSRGSRHAVVEHIHSDEDEETEALLLTEVEGGKLSSKDETKSTRVTVEKSSAIWTFEMAL